MINNDYTSIATTFSVATKTSPNKTLSIFFPGKKGTTMEQLIEDVAKSLNEIMPPHRYGVITEIADIVRRTFDNNIPGVLYVEQTTTGYEVLARNTKGVRFRQQLS